MRGVVLGFVFLCCMACGYLCSWAWSGRLKDLRSVEEAKRALGSADSSRRRVALVWLSRHVEGLVVAMRKVAETDPDEETRRYAARLLEHLRAK